MSRISMLASTLLAASLGCSTVAIEHGHGTVTTAATGAGTISTDVPRPPLPPRPVDDGVAWDKAGLDWSKPPAPLATTPYVPPTAISFALRNGANVVLIENHRLPLVSMSVSIAGAGTAHAQSGLAALTADLLDEAAGKLNAEQLPEALERLGADLSTGAGRDRAIVSLDTVRDAFPAAVVLLADVLLQPRLTPVDFKRVKADRLEDLRTRSDSPGRVAGLVFDQVLFAGLPYGEPGAGFVDTVEKLTQPDVLAFWRTHYVADRATIVVAGDIDQATLAALLDRSLGSWKGTPAKAAAATPSPLPQVPTRGVPASASPRIVVVDKPAAPQSIVFIGGRAPDAGDAAFDAAELSNTALGGTFSSRLNGRLREELGYTYGISSGNNRGQLAGSWNVRTSLRTDVTIAGIKEVLRIVEATRSTTLPAAEFAKTQAYLVGQFPQAFESNASIVGAFDELLTRHRPLTDYATFESRTRALTPIAAKGAVASTWQGLSIVVVGDLAVIGKELATLGLPVIRVDGSGVPITP